MTLLVTHATIITCDAQRNIHHDSALAIEGDCIVAIGSNEEVRAKYPAAEEISARGKAIFPGLTNAHTHLLKNAGRGVFEDFGFPTTLRFPEAPRDLMTSDEENVYALLGALEGLRSGTTCFLEIEYGIASYAQSLAKTGLRFVFGEYVNDLDEDEQREGRYVFREHLREKGLRVTADLVEKWNGAAEGRIICFTSPATPEDSSPELLRKSREMSEHYGVGSTIHLSESYNEIEGVMRVRGVRPTHYLFANDFLWDRLVVAHCRYIDSSEIALLGETEANVSNNPAIAARRGVAAPVKELQAAGCTIGMGSDNMAEDMVEVLRTGLFLERVRRNDQMWPQPEDVLDGATRGGAKAVGLDDKTGSLEVGKKADFFMINTQRAHLVPTLRIVSGFVHNGQPSDITDVMVDGQWIMRDGKVLTIDEETVVREAEKIGHSLWQRLLKKHPSISLPVRLSPGLSR